MSKEIHFCEECGTSYGVEKHHVIFKSECKPLEHCPLNYAYLCGRHHRDHRIGVHHNEKQNIKYKLRFQNDLEMLFDKELLTREEIQEVLQIADKPLNRLLKTIKTKKGKYIRESLICYCMGPKGIIEGDTE